MKIQFSTDLEQRDDGFYVVSCVEGVKGSEVGPVASKELAVKIQNDVHNEAVKSIERSKQQILMALEKWRRPRQQNAPTRPSQTGDR